MEVRINHRSQKIKKSKRTNVLLVACSYSLVVSMDRRRELLLPVVSPLWECAIKEKRRKKVLFEINELANYFIDLKNICTVYPIFFFFFLYPILWLCEPSPGFGSYDINNSNLWLNRRSSMTCVISTVPDRKFP